MRALVSVLNSDIVAVSESWLKCDISSQLLDINGYHITRCDRTDRKGGGITVWTRYGIKFLHLQCNIPHCIEAVWLFLIDSSCIFCSIYIPPNLSSADKFTVTEHLIDTADFFMTFHKCHSLIVCGDFNVTNFNITPIISQLNLHNIVSETTRPSSDTILDLVLVSSNLANNVNSEVGPPLQCDSDSGVSSDHCVIKTFNYFNAAEITAKTCHTVYDLRQSNVDTFIDELLRSGFADIYMDVSANKKCEIFYSVLHRAMRVLPRRSVTMTSKDKPWITPIIKCMINDRWNAYRLRNWPVFNHLKVKIKQEIVNSKARWSEKKSKTVKGMWDFVKEIGGTLKNNDWFTKVFGKKSDIQSNLNDINNHFASVFHPKENITLIDCKDDNSLTEDIEAYLIHKLLSASKNKAMGSDGIPSKLYHGASLIISDPLAHLINACLKDHIMPDIWKLAHILPIPKTSPPAADQLRPISLLPVPSKILERVLLLQFRDQLTSWYGANQFAYRSKSSTLCALISLHDHITKLLDSDDTAAVILLSLDFSKAFDCISHPLLIGKLKDYNFSDKFVAFISSYLAGRTQAVKYGGFLSELRQVTSGVPQGSVLGPFLFCIYVSSLQATDDISKMFKFADDTQLISLIRKTLFDEDIDTLKCTLNSIKTWSSGNKLRLNNDKSKAIVYQKSKSQAVCMDDIDVSIKVVNEMKILGVIFNDRLSWDTHIDSLVKTCSQRFYLLRQLKPFLNDIQLTDVYNGIIRSKMEYCSPLFISLNVREKQKLTSLHKRFHRLRCGVGCPNNCLENLDDRRVKIATRIWHELSGSEHHILGHLGSQRLLRTGHYQVTYCKTERRRCAFALTMPIILNTTSS